MTSTAIVLAAPTAAAEAVYRAGATAVIELAGGAHVQPRNTRRRTVVCNASGVPESDGWIPDAVHGDVTWEVSAPDQWSITVPLTSPGVTAVVPSGGVGERGNGDPYREVTLWRGDDCLTWGPAHSPDVARGVATVRGSGLLWYASRRFIGWADARNMLSNHDFSAGFDYWNPTVADVQTRTFQLPDANAFSEVAPHPLTGRPAVHVHCANGGPPTSWILPFVWQAHSINATGYAHDVTVTCDVYVTNLTTPNMWKAGVQVAFYPDAWTDIFLDFKENNASTIDERFPVGSTGEMRRERATITIPAATSGVVMVKLFGLADGDVWYSDPVLDVDWAFDFTGVDQGEIVWKLADHIHGNTASPFINAWRNPNYPTDTDGYGKSNLHIDAEVVTTGVKRTRLYRHGQRTTGLAALTEFARLDDGIELWMDYRPADPTRPRILRGSRRKGRNRRDLPLRYGPGPNQGNVVDFAWSFLGEQGANSIVTRSSPGGLAIPEGAAIDATSFAGGLTLEDVLTAPVEARPDTLGDRSTYTLHQRRRPVNLAVTIPASPYFDLGLRVGDRVPVAIHAGLFHLTEELMWIKRITLTGSDWLQLHLQGWVYD